MLKLTPIAFLRAHWFDLWGWAGADRISWLILSHLAHPRYSNFGCSKGYSASSSPLFLMNTWRLRDWAEPDVRPHSKEAIKSWRKLRSYKKKLFYIENCAFSTVLFGSMILGAMPITYQILNKYKKHSCNANESETMNCFELSRPPKTHTHKCEKQIYK